MWYLVKCLAAKGEAAVTWIGSAIGFTDLNHAIGLFTFMLFKANWAVFEPKT